MKAIWNNTIIGESNDIVNIEGNAYFPTESANKNHLKESLITTICTWKGKAAYYSIEVDGKTNKDAA